MNSIESSKVKKILVTGSSGAIGCVLCSFLIKEGYYIRGFDKRKGGTTNEFYQGNILDKRAINVALNDIDAVIHLAGCSDESDFETDLVPNNIFGLKNILDEACNQNVSKLILASSIQTVDFSSHKKSFSVRDKSPFNFYGLTKSWGEDLAELYSKEYNISIIIARLGWFLRSKEEFEEARHYPNGGDLYLSPNDLCQFFVKCLHVKDIRFETLYATSIPANYEIFDLKPSRLKINFLPEDSFPINYKTKSSNEISSNVNIGEFNLVHITDTHIFKDKNGILYGVNTFCKFRDVIQHIKEGAKETDAVIITGDLSEDGSSESYILLKKEIDKLNVPSFWLPGNHDNFANIPKDIALKHVFEFVEFSNWSLIFIDTTVKGEDYGKINVEELQRLDSFLYKNQEKQIIICMHHHPVEMQSEFIDSIGLKNKEELWALLSPYKNIKAILCGHIHQEFNQTINNVAILSPPSTCVQWKSFSKEFNFTKNESGYLKIHLDKSSILESIIKKIRSI